MVVAGRHLDGPAGAVVALMTGRRRVARAVATLRAAVTRACTRRPLGPLAPTSIH